MSSTSVRPWIQFYIPFNYVEWILYPIELKQLFQIIFILLKFPGLYLGHCLAGNLNKNRDPLPFIYSPCNMSILGLLFEVKPSIVSTIRSPVTNAWTLISQLFILSFTPLCALLWNSSFIIAYKHVPSSAIQRDTQIKKKPANSDNKTILLAIPPVLATAFPLSFLFWKTVFSLGRSSFSYHTTQSLQLAFCIQRSLSVLLPNPMANIQLLPYDSLWRTRLGWWLTAS